MLPVTFKSKRFRQLCMLLVEREKGLPNLFIFVKAQCSKTNPEYAGYNLAQVARNLAGAKFFKSTLIINIYKAQIW